MINVGRIVHYFPTKPGNWRNTEGSFIRLKDNSILYAYSRYGNSSADDSVSSIAVVRSTDEGDNFGEHRILLQQKDKENLMCPSFMRMRNGDVGMFYLYRSNVKPGAVVRFVRSADEGQTWSEPLTITSPDEYVVFENGHAIRLQSGRILVPVAYHGKADAFNFHAEMTCVMSDDDGYTWFETTERKKMAVPAPLSESGLQEPVAYQMKNGRIRCFSRTDLFCQYESDSDDDGMTWTEPMPNRVFSSPCSPMMIKPLDGGKYIVALFNPIPKFVTRDRTKDERSPLIALISADDGATFDWDKALTLDDRGHCCYPDMFDGGNYFLVGYQKLDDGVIMKIDAWEFEQGIPR